MSKLIKVETKMRNSKFIYIIFLYFFIISCAGQKKLDNQVKIKVGAYVKISKDMQEDFNEIQGLLNNLLNTKDYLEFDEKFDNENSKILKYPCIDLYNILHSMPKNHEPLLMVFQKENYDKYLLKIGVVGKNKGQYSIVNIYNIFAIRYFNTFKFRSLIDYNLRKWKMEKINNIIYYYENKGKDFMNQYEKQKEFENKLIRKFEVKRLHYKYIICRDNSSIYKVCGFDFEPTMYVSKKGGICFQKNIFSGNNSAFYPHELVHIYTKKYFPDIHNIIDEGVATYLGGSLGLSYKEQKQELKEYYSYKEQNIFHDLMDETIRKTRISEHSSLLYAGGALICDLVYSKLGIEGLKTLMSSGKTDEELIITLEKLLDTNRDKINELLINYLNKK